MSDSHTLTDSLDRYASLRRNLSDLADAATRGATRGGLSMPEFEKEMTAINAAYAAGLETVRELEIRSA